MPDITSSPKLDRRTLFVSIAVASSAGADEVFRLFRPQTRPHVLSGIPCQDYQFGQRSRSEIVISRTALLLPSRTAITDALSPSSRGTRIESTSRDLETIGRDGRDRLRIDRRSTNSATEATPRGTRERTETTRDFELLPPPISRQPIIADRDVTVRDTQTVFPAVRPQPDPNATKLFQLDRAALVIDHCQISNVALWLDQAGEWALSLRADQNKRTVEEEEQGYNARLHLKRNQFHLNLRCLGNFRTPTRTAAEGAGRLILAELLPQPFWVENSQPRHLRLAGRSWLAKDFFHDIDRVEIEFYYD